MELEIRDLIEHLYSQNRRGLYPTLEWEAMKYVIYQLESILDGTR